MASVNGQARLAVTSRWSKDPVASRNRAPRRRRGKGQTRGTSERGGCSARRTRARRRHAPNVRLWRADVLCRQLLFLWTESDGRIEGGEGMAGLAREERCSVLARQRVLVAGQCTTQRSEPAATAPEA